jgi:hypothetical protein
MLGSPEETRKLRFKYLYEVYKLAMEKAEHTSGFDRFRYAVDKYEVGNRLNLNRNRVDNILEYHYREGLVKTHSVGESRAFIGYSEINTIEPTHLLLITLMLTTVSGSYLHYLQEQGYQSVHLERHD